MKFEDPKMRSSNVTDGLNKCNSKKQQKMSQMQYAAPTFSRLSV